MNYQGLGVPKARKDLAYKKVCKQQVMRTRIKLALILVHMTSASNEQRRTKSVSCELPGLGSAEGTERPGLQKSM